MSGCPGLFAGPLAALVVLLCAPRASASPFYPQQLQQDLGMPCAPPCTVCHRDSNGGLKTVVKPFGQAMYSAGLRAQSADGLRAAEKTLDSNGTDSDGDGTPDIDELRVGSDPNATGGNLCGEGPAYGCGAHVAPQSHVGGLGLLFAALVGALFLGLRRRY